MMSLTTLLGNILPFQVDYFIVGLGNPGTDYEETPHNIGFQVLDALALHWKTPLKSHAKASGRLGVASFEGKRVLLLQPSTYMNLSGKAVAPLMQLYDLSPEQLLVVVDEIHLPFGAMRLRPKGSAGGQNGMKSIIASLQGEQGFPRLRVGIGKPPEGMPLETYVLSSYNAVQQGELKNICEKAVSCIESVLIHGVAKTQNEFNG
jgi:peptidyl-tRNA hydrolase, PTH1 family